MPPLPVVAAAAAAATAAAPAPPPPSEFSASTDWEKKEGADPELAAEAAALPFGNLFYFRCGGG